MPVEALPEKGRPVGCHAKPSAKRSSQMLKGIYNENRSRIMKIQSARSGQ